MNNKEESELFANDAIIKARKDLVSIMADKQLNYSKLADLMGVSRAMITFWFNSGSEITVKSLNSIANILGYRIRISFEKKRKWNVEENE